MPRHPHLNSRPQSSGPLTSDGPLSPLPSSLLWTTIVLSLWEAAKPLSVPSNGSNKALGAGACPSPLQPRKWETAKGAGNEDPPSPPPSHSLPCTQSAVGLGHKATASACGCHEREGPGPPAFHCALSTAPTCAAQPLGPGVKAAL